MVVTDCHLAEAMPVRFLHCEITLFFKCSLEVSHKERMC